MDDPAWEFDARYLAFLETIASLRPSLHRYCARMPGSTLDGVSEIRPGGLDRRDDIRRERGRLRFDLHAAAAQKVDAAVVRDPEQPR